MKKIKYLSLIVLSLLFVGFSYGDMYNLGNTLSNNVVSFEYPTVSKNIHYALLGGSAGSSALGYSRFNYGLTKNSFQGATFFYLSQYNYFSGLSFEQSLRPQFFISSLEKTGFNNNYFNGFLVLNQNGNTFSSNSIHYLAVSNNTSINKNGIVSFGNGTYTSFDNSLIAQNNYIRYFYSPQTNGINNFWANTTTPDVSDITDNPIYFQKFKSDEVGFLTQKGQVAIANYGTLFGISPAISMGFGFFKNFQGNSNWSDLVLGTVFPFYDSYQSAGNYSLPSWAYTNQYYMFRLDSLKYNSDAGHIGVISKCTPEICSGSSLYSDVLYSEYNCNLPGNGLTINTSSKYINFKESCLYLQGGIIHNFFPYTSATGSANFVLANSNYSAGSFNRFNPYFNFYFNNTTLSYCVVGYYIGGQSSYIHPTAECPSSLTLGTLDTSIAIDILGTFQNNTGYVPDPEVFQGTPKERAIDVICNLPQFGKNPICNDGIFDSSQSTDIIFDTDSGGNLYAVVTLYNTGDENCPDEYYTGSDGIRYHQYFDRVCYVAVSVDRVDSTPGSGSELTENLGTLESSISTAFSGVLGGNFKFYSCPFNSPLGALKLSSIGGLSSFLLDKFFDINLIGPFNCLIGGALYSVAQTDDLGSELFSYSGPKYFSNFPKKVKNIIDMMLLSTLFLFFRRFRPNNHDD